MKLYNIIIILFISISANADETNLTKISISEKSLATELCENYEANIYINGKNDSDFLLACECNCTSHDNFGWYVSKKSINGLFLGKTNFNMINSNKLVEDIMTNHRLCTPIDKKLLNDSQYTTLIKYPTGEENNPYCFEARYIFSDNGFYVIENGERISKHDDEFFFETEESKLQAIKEIMRKFNIP